MRPLLFLLLASTGYAGPPAFRRVLEPLRYPAGWTAPVYLSTEAPFTPVYHRLSVYADFVEGRGRYGFSSTAARWVEISVFPTHLPAPEDLVLGQLPTKPSGPAVWSRKFRAREDVVELWRGTIKDQLNDPKQILETWSFDRPRSARDGGTKDAGDRVFPGVGWGALGVGVKRYGSVRHGVPSRIEACVYQPTLEQERNSSWSWENYRRLPDGTREWGSDAIGWRRHPWTAAVPSYEMSADRWLPKLAPGTYVIRAESDKGEAQKAFHYNRLQTFHHLAPGKIDLLVFDEKRRPAEGAEVTLLRQDGSEPPLRTRTRGGQATLTVPWAGTASGTIHIRKGPDATWIRLRGDRCGLGPTRLSRIHLAVEKTRVRAGERVRFRVQGLHPVGQGGWRVPESLHYRTDGGGPWQSLKMSPGGVGSGEVPAHDRLQFALGKRKNDRCPTWPKREFTPSQSRYELHHFVDDPRFEEVRVKVSPAQAIVRQGSTTDLTLEVTTGAGDPLALQEVTWRVSSQPSYYSSYHQEDPSAFGRLSRHVAATVPPGNATARFGPFVRSATRKGRLRLNQEGRAALPIGVPRLEGAAKLLVEVVVKDQRGREWRGSADLFAPPADRYLAIRSDRSWVMPGETLDGTVDVRDLKGQPVSGPVQMQLSEIVHVPQDRGWSEPQRKLRKKWVIEANAAGQARFSTSIRFPGEAVVAASVLGSDRIGFADVEQSVAVVPTEASSQDEARIRVWPAPPGKDIPGKTRLRLSIPKSGRPLWWWFAHENFDGFHRIAETGNTPLLVIPAPQAHAQPSRLQIAVPGRTAIHSGFHDVLPPLEKPPLEVTIQSPEAVLSPGDQAALTVQVRTAAGVPWEGPLVATVRDAPQAQPILGYGPLPPAPDPGGDHAAYWNPGLRTDAQGKATIRFQVPPAIARWRVRVDAVGADDSVGTTELLLPVRLR